MRASVRACVQRHRCSPHHLRPARTPWDSTALSINRRSLDRKRRRRTPSAKPEVRGAGSLPVTMRATICPSPHCVLHQGSAPVTARHLVYETDTPPRRGVGTSLSGTTPLGRDFTKPERRTRIRAGGLWCVIQGRLGTYIHETYLNTFHPHGGGAPGASLGGSDFASDLNQRLKPPLGSRRT